MGTGPLLSRRATLMLAAAGLGAGALSLAGCGGDHDMITADVRREAPAAAPNDALLRALGDFAGALTGALASPDGNLICSPLSAQLALAMTRNGAVGATAQEMDAALRFPPPAQLNPGLNTAVQLLERRGGKRAAGERKGTVSLDIADRVYGEKTFTWHTAFLSVLARYYGTGIAPADFIDNPDGGRRAMNAWVAGQTHDKIVDLLPPGTITSDTRLTLINAVYLKAPWLLPFGDARPGPFHTGDGRTVQAPLMRASYHGRAATGAGWQAVEIPYLGGELAMTAVLPDDAAAMPGLLRQGLIATVLSALSDGWDLTVTMPRFTVRSRIDLKRILSDLGMRTAFTDAADFSAMTGDRPLKIEHVLQQGWIAVDEQGTEAAAATAVVAVATSASTQRITLVLDRPFWFVIHDRATRIPIMVGHVADPTAH